MGFKIEGWFPPIKYKSHLDGKTYAICDGKWVEIPETMTYEEVLKGWVCIAKDAPPKSNTYKKVTKTSLQQKTIKDATENTNDIIKRILKKRASDKSKQPSLF